jgi:hypothetical protein
MKASALKKPRVAESSAALKKTKQSAKIIGKMKETEAFDAGGPSLARIHPLHDLDDESHQALDEAVLDYFNPEATPRWDQLLHTIANDDKRLSRPTLKRTKELLEHESSLLAVLQEGWETRSFKEIRRLGMSLCSHRIMVIDSHLPHCQRCCGIKNRLRCQPDMKLDHMKVRFWSLTSLFCDC